MKYYDRNGLFTKLLCEKSKTTEKRVEETLVEGVVIIIYSLYGTILV